MPTQQQLEAQARIDARKAQMAQQQTGQDIARANIGNAYVGTGTGEDFVYDKTKAPGYVAPVAPQQAAAARLTANGVDPTKLGTGVGENYQPYQVKPIIATSTDPVKSTPSATTPTVTTPGDYTAMTPEQLKAQYMTIGTKLPGEITDEDRRFTKYLQTRMSLGETVDKIFGTNASKSSGTTTYSPQLNHASEQYDSSVKNADGTYTVKYKDGSSQVITEPPTKTIFPEGTPEYFAQKQADEAQIRLDALTEQMKTEEERRKKETADLTAKYGENIATQFATQKADIEANGAKRMDTLNTGLSFSGFGRSTLALEKRDEIAKNIEATVNQAKAKADLELMAFRMEREGADATAIDAMRKNIADVQQKIDDANYANQLEIIKLNQENATTGSEAMNNLLATISDSEQIVSNADIEKSQTLGYFVNKDGSIMLDSQKRPIQFEGNPGSLDPSAIGAYADALNKKIIDEKALDKLSPADKAAVLKHVGVQNGTWTGAIGGDVSTASGDLRGLRSQYPSEAWSGTNNPTGLTVSPSFSQKLQQAGIQFTTKPRPSNEGGEYYVFSDISDGLQAHNIALKTSGWQDVYQRLYKWSAGGTADTPQSEKEANKKAYAENLMRQAGIPMGTKFSEITPEQEAKLLSAHIAKESPNLYKVLTSGQGGDGVMGSAGVPLTYQRRIEQMVPVQLRNSDAESQKLMADIKNLFQSGVSPEDATLMYLGFNVKDEAKKSKAMELVGKARGLGADLPEDFFIKLSDYVNKGNVAGAETFTNRIVDGVLKEQIGADFISTPNLNFTQSTLTRLQKLIEKNKDKIGPMTGRFSDLKKKLANDPDYQALSTLLSGSNADVRRAFGGTAVTDSELSALRDFIGADTKMPIQNLLTALQTNFDTLKSRYDSQRDFYTEDTVGSTTPQNNTILETESDWWTVN